MTTDITAQYFTQTFLGSDLRSSGLLDATLFDEDLIRGDDADERIESSDGLTIFNGFTSFVQTGTSLDSVQRVFTDGEVSTTVTFTDGTTLSGVLGLYDSQVFNFGVTTQLYLLDQGALAEIGRTLADVADVQVDDFVDHDLSYADLGFGAAPVSPPPAPEPVTDYVLIQGTDGGDRLKGSDEADVIIGGDGNDVLKGRGGADVFVFGADANDGGRDRDVIRDFNPDEDILVLEDDAAIRRVTELDNGNLRIQLEGDRDTIIIRDADASIIDDIVFVDDAFVF